MCSSITKKMRLSQELQDHGEPEVNIVIKMPYDNWSNKFNEMRINNQLCDVKIVANNGESFLAHKVLLAANSEYFNIMFNSGFKEATESEIIIQEVDPHVLKLLIDFIYTSELLVTEQYIQEILIGICLLQFDESVRNKCVDFIKSNIYISNCLNMKEMAECLGLSEFYSYCLDYVLENYMLVIENEEFVLISFDQILQMIKSDYLCSKEEVVYKSVMKWIKHDLKNRLKHLPELLEYVRLPLVSSEYLKLVDAEPLLKNIDCIKYLTEAYAVQAVNGTGLEVSQSIRTKYRSNYSEYILIMSNSGKKHLPLLFNCVTDKWKTMPIILPSNSAGTIMLLEDGRIIDIGGLQSNFHCNYSVDPHSQFLDDPFWDLQEDYHNVIEMNTASIYDFADNHWIDIERTQAFHINSNMVQIDCRVYVIGNYHCEYYNMDINKWFGINTMLSKRVNFEIIVLNGLIYAIGGKVGISEVNTVDIFDPEKAIWTHGTPMRYKRASPSLCVYKHCIYAIGGWANPNKYLDKVEKYDPITETWVEVASLNKRRSKAGAVAMNGLIYVFGGANSNYSIESYCTYRNKWTLLASKVPNSLGCNSMCHAFVVNQEIQHKFLNSTD